MALSKLWLEVVKEDQSVVEKAISSSIGRFGHTVLRAAQAEAVTKASKNFPVQLL